MSGSHIVIGHERAPWLEIFARGKRAHRTREEALALARDIFRKARAEPTRFTDLVQRHSEHRDASADGDFGAWSTLEITPYPSRTKRLQELAVGEVGAPIETHLGFEIILRTAPRSREQYRAARLVFPVASADTEIPQAPDRAARAMALAKAEGVLQRLARDPSAFDALGPDEAQWEEGRGSLSLTAALASLQPGQLTSAPVDTEEGFVIARRLEPEPVEPTEVESDFPAPREPELRELFAALPPTDSVPFLRELTEETSRESSTEGGTGQELHEVFDRHELARINESTPLEARSRLLGDWFDRSRQELGERGYERYRTALGRAAAARFIRVPDTHGVLGL